VFCISELAKTYHVVRIVSKGRSRALPATAVGLLMNQVISLFNDLLSGNNRGPRFR
jgi:hypothetical protein